MQIQSEEPAMSSQSKQSPELNRADTGTIADAALSSTLDSGHTHNTAGPCATAAASTSHRSSSSPNGSLSSLRPDSRPGLPSHPPGLRQPRLRPSPVSFN